MYSRIEKPALVLLILNCQLCYVACWILAR